MRHQASDRTVRLLLLGSFVLTVGTAAVSWAEARGGAHEHIAWVLAGALLALVVTGCWALHRAAVAIVALQTRSQQMQTRIKEFTSSQGRFVRNIAHYLKTPLTIVLNQAELLLRCGNDPPAVRGHAKGIADYMLHLSDLFESFLRLARPFEQADTSHHVPVHIHDLVMEAVSRSESMARVSGVRVVATFEEPGGDDGALEVLGDAVLIKAMIEHLVRNAVRLSPRGSSVGMQVRVRGESILLYVRDQGTGIAPSDLESVFDWCFETPGMPLQSPGPGFGLAIAKRVADHHRGTISLRNHPEGGCEFEITLPRWRAEGLHSCDGGASVGIPAATRPATEVMQ